jgi:hypothetical protein
MRLNGVTNLRRLAVFARHDRARGGVGAIDFLIDTATDVVQKPGAASDLDRIAQFSSDGAGEKADLDRMLKQVLRRPRTKTQFAEQAAEIRVQAADAEIEGGLIAGFFALLLDVIRRLAHHFFDAGGMDAAVRDEPGQRQARNFAPYGIEAGDDDRLGRIVDDQIDAGGGFEGSDVAALAPDDAPLHVIRR